MDREGECFNRLRAMGDILARSKSFSDFNLKTPKPVNMTFTGNAKQSNAAAATIFFWITDKQPAGLYASGLPYSFFINVTKRNIMKQL